MSKRLRATRRVVNLFFSYFLVPLVPAAGHEQARKGASSGCLAWIGAAARHRRATTLRVSLLPALRSGRRTKVLIHAGQPNCGAVWLPGLDSNQNWVSQSHLCYHYTTRQWSETAYVALIENTVKAGKTRDGCYGGAFAPGNEACAG